MQAPMVHIGGTSKQSLMDDNQAAYSAVCAAMEKLQAAAPNGRDFYPVGPDALKLAQGEHRARLKSLQGIAQDLMELMEAIDTQEGR